MLLIYLLLYPIYGIDTPFNKIIEFIELSFYLSDSQMHFFIKSRIDSNSIMELDFRYFQFYMVRTNNIIHRKQ